MSMLSAQIDKLRYEADMLRDHGTFIGYGGLTSTNPEMIECADLMCDAADTIWQLRDDLQRTNAENARLRELAEKAWKAAEMLCQAFDGPCRDDGTTIYKPCPLGERDELCVYGLIQRDLRELGVEVP